MIHKTNALRFLDKEVVDYQIYEYSCDDNKIDGLAVAAKIGHDPLNVYKTLVTQGSSGGLFVFVIPVEEELDLKKAAKAAGEKNIAMLPVKDINKYTGYIRGGCSPVGMKKEYPTFIDENAQLLDFIIVSAGKIGLQMQLLPDDLLAVCHGKCAEICK
ncbi:MAG: Cys-tRNA(Pro) deacylase [Clostridiales bacterium]